MLDPFAVADAINLGKQIYDRVQTVRKFKESTKRLGYRLQFMMTILEEIKSLSRSGQLHLEAHGRPTSVKIGFNILTECITEADEFTEDLSQKSRLMKFLTAGKTVRTFTSLSEKLNAALSNMVLAIQVEEIKDREMEFAGVKKAIHDSQIVFEDRWKTDKKDLQTDLQEERGKLEKQKQDQEAKEPAQESGASGKTRETSPQPPSKLIARGINPQPTPHSHRETGATVEDLEAEIINIDQILGCLDELIREESKITKEAIDKAVARY